MRQKKLTREEALVCLNQASLEGMFALGMFDKEKAKGKKEHWRKEAERCMAQCQAAIRMYPDLGEEMRL